MSDCDDHGQKGKGQGQRSPCRVTQGHECNALPKVSQKVETTQNEAKRQITRPRTNGKCHPK